MEKQKRTPKKKETERRTAGKRRLWHRDESRWELGSQVGLSEMVSQLGEKPVWRTTEERKAAAAQMPSHAYQ